MMSAGSHGEEQAEQPLIEQLVWRVAKDSGIAEARVRVVPHGRELRVVVNDALLASRFFRDDGDNRELGSTAMGLRQTFEAEGWQHVPG
jgi:hypothetical protein